MHLKKLYTLEGAYFFVKKSISDSELRISTKTEFYSALGVEKMFMGQIVC